MKNRYNLGIQGRRKINKRLYKNNYFFDKNFLTSEDVLGITNFLINKHYEFVLYILKLI